MFAVHPISAIILDTICKSTILLALARGAAFTLKKCSAATQHMVRVFTLAALLLLPFSSMLLPAWHVKGIPQFFKTQSQAPRNTTLQQDIATTAPAPVKHEEQSSSGTVRSVNKQKLQSESVMHSSASAPTVSISNLAPPAPSPTNYSLPRSSTVSTVQSSSYIVPAFIALWLAGVLFFLGRWKLNALRLAGLVRRASVLTDSGWNAQVRALAADLRIHRHVALLVSDEIEIPITSGILFPRIILSPDYTEWSSLRRFAILQHELAHIQRLDALTQSLAQLTTALYWFHPLVWFMVRAMRVERERACDDQVLASGAKASDYAHELLDIVSGLCEPQLTAALAMARRSQQEGRVLAVLNPATRRGSVSRKAALAIAALTLSIVLPLAAMQPALQSGSNAPAPKTATTKSKPSPSTSTAPVPQGNTAPSASERDNDQAAEAPER